MTPTGSLGRLADTLAAIEHDLAGITGQPDAFAALTRLATQRVHGAEFAGLTIGRNGRFTSAGHTDERVRLVDAIQYELSSGPCVDAGIEGAVFLSDDLRTDTRWPDFGSRAFEATQVVSMLSFRLFLEDEPEVVAALNLYSRTVAAFDETSTESGLLIATAGTLAIGGAAARARAGNLEHALASRTEIGIAIGVLMSQLKVTREQGFDLLRVASQASQRKLADLARDVADTGILPDLPPRA